ncbi:metabolite traffic protein EboE [Cyclobacteriaceae bacterium]|nr:metabolite traffic protein EboE [Cyclobacteriaceae bacterium]MDB4742053.1 metabolite traffic protein EboE [Cyclobacteriaceae bacterium]
MKIEHHQAHLTYCSNIHPGESWDETFHNLKTYTTQVRKGLTESPFGIGLRLSHLAALELIKETQLNAFQAWLREENMYVFTFNGFPYGGFHHQKVKDAVHQPDWSTSDRLAYTQRLFLILSKLLPEGMDGGVSTSPISYRHWHRTEKELNRVKSAACEQFTELICYLKKLKDATGKNLHLDLEPEPDGVIETSKEFVSFFNDYLLVKALPEISNRLGVTEKEADQIIRTHFQMCYDVCHFAVGFEKPVEALSRIKNADINIGRIQISAALGSGNIRNQSDPSWVPIELLPFDEPTYLHQAVVKRSDGKLMRYTDLGSALSSLDEYAYDEIRTHFHVPVFTETYGKLYSTQEDIIETLRLWLKDPFTQHLEVETYTWDVLPKNMQTDRVNSIIRELNWVKKTLNKHAEVE